MNIIENEKTNSFHQTDNHFISEHKYTLEDKEFIVRPVFKDDCKETVGTILLRLIKSEMK